MHIKTDGINEKDIKESLFWYGFFQGTLNIFAGFNQAVQVYLSNWLDKNWTSIVNAYENRNVIILDDKNDDKKISIVEIQEANKIEDNVETEDIDESKTIQKEDLVYIPLKITYEDRENYELTQYINDITYANTQVLMEYGRKDKINTAYSYGNERITYEEINKTSYYLYDGRGSVANITGQDGNSMVNYNYDAYGSSTVSGKTNNKYGYNAEYTEPVTGMQYLRARYYEPTTGNFTTQDSYLGTLISPVTQNRYAYAGNNPVNNIDPSGHFGMSLGNFIGNSIREETLSGVVNTVSKTATVASKTNKVISNIISQKKVVSNPIVKFQEEINKLQGIDDQIKALMNKASFVGTAKERSNILKKIEELTALRKNVCDSVNKLKEQIPINYDRDEARKYAQTYEESVNEAKYSLYKIGDCANFASQIIHAGGIPYTEQWHVYEANIFSKIKNQIKYAATPSWSITKENLEYFKNSHYVKETLYIRSIEELQANLYKIQTGDIAYIATKYDNYMDHTIVVSKVTESDLLYTGHTDPRFDDSIIKLYFKDKDGNIKDNPILVINLIKDEFLK